MIHVIGDIIIDEYWYGSSTRLSPEAPIPIVNLKSKKISLGGAGNTYMNIKSATNDVSLYGYTSDIHNYILDKINPHGNIVNTNIIPHKVRVMCDNFITSRIDHEVFIEDIEVESDFQINNPYDVVVLSDYNKGTIKYPQNIIEKSKRCIVDPKKPLNQYKGAYILKPNRKEFEEWIRRDNLDPKNLLTEARRVRDDLDIEHFMVTLGSEGVLYVGDTIEHYPATEEKVFDVTGAGDTFTATLAICCSMDYPIYKGVMVANIMSGEAVKTIGTYMIDTNKLAKVMEEVV
jgi:D-beta-D-heptose 7-phosphate kinase/D-beta-D-heptose 1-phosphate adenosyltransferase|tara:strand:- start:488 stop:1354 length:867 start_codon:yes stop_codon:yes gene_type:complete